MLSQTRCSQKTLLLSASLVVLMLMILMTLITPSTVTPRFTSLLDFTNAAAKNNLSNLSSSNAVVDHQRRPVLLHHNEFQIPKILHQAFTSEMVYQAYKPLINGCLTINPDFEYYLWRDSDAVSLIKKDYPQYLKQYTEFTDDLQKSDAIRYIVLHRFGGIYLDMDVQCRRPFFPSPSLSGRAAFLDQERREQTRILWGSEFSAMNSAMGSVPGHPFFRLVADRVLTRKPDGSAFSSTGPYILTKLLLEYWSSGSSNNSNSSTGARVKQQWPVTLLEPSVMSPLMDALKNWKARCKEPLKAACGQQNTSNQQHQQQQQQQLTWSTRGCLLLQSKQWQLDDSNSETVAVHRFLHLGYDSSSDKRKRPKFNATSAFFPRIKFYNNSSHNSQTTAN